MTPKLSNLLGNKNITNVRVNNDSYFVLIDSGSDVSTITRSYIPDGNMQSLDIPHTVRAAGDLVVGYLRVAEIDVDLDPDVGDANDTLTLLALILPDSSIDANVPLISGTRVIRHYYESCKQKDPSVSAISFPEAWQVASVAMKRLILMMVLLVW